MKIGIIGCGKIADFWKGVPDAKKTLDSMRA